MFFIPLSQIESVELVIHALKAAGGEADCSACPVRKVCMKQCLSIAEAVAGMVESGALPALDKVPVSKTGEVKSAPKNSDKGHHLKVIK